MFQYKKDKELFYIWSDRSKGKFGAFIGIFCKNRYLGEIEADAELEKKYPGHGFSHGYTKTKIFIINKNGIEKIIKR
ncbi:MAG: hypothetical protein Q9M94_05460 [Candidatus Gracilibacteria bacterium]|nr:hypothetical protein [Candidatus Gracilibacteria bacterium]